MKLQIAGLVNDSIVDGPGYRFTVFVQGCPHLCPGCHNPATHDPAGGRSADTDEIFAQIKKNPLLSGVTFSGGEPLDQSEPLLELAKKIRENLALDIWIYTGYTFEEIAAKFAENPLILELLQLSDVLVDGRFINAERDISLPFRGSRNQRLIDLKRTLAEHRVILAQ